MANSELDGRRISAARNQSFFREVNERIEELATQWSSNGHFLCECLDTSCAETVSISAEEYHRIREDADCFFVLAGHEVQEIEEVVARTDGYFVVRKLGVGGEVAAQSSTWKEPRAPS